MQAFLGNLAKDSYQISFKPCAQTSDHNPQLSDRTIRANGDPASLAPLHPFSLTDQNNHSRKLDPRAIFANVNAQVKVNFRDIHPTANSGHFSKYLDTLTSSSLPPIFLDTVHILKPGVPPPEPLRGTSRKGEKS